MPPKLSLEDLEELVRQKIARSRAAELVRQRRLGNFMDQIFTGEEDIPTQLPQGPFAGQNSRDLSINERTGRPFLDPKGESLRFVERDKRRGEDPQEIFKPIPRQFGVNRIPEGSNPESRKEEERKLKAARQLGLGIGGAFHPGMLIPLLLK